MARQVTFYRRKKHKFRVLGKDAQKRIVKSESPQRRLVGFYTDGEGRIRPITKALDIHRNRSPVAQRTDEAIKAKLAKSYEEWAKQPNRRDLRGVDYPEEERRKEEKKEPWMTDDPFTKDEVEWYNHFSHFYVDINKQFRQQVEAKEGETYRRLAEYGIYETPSDVKKALYYYRKALYQYYLDESRARAKAPPVMVVGASKYYQYARPKQAERIREKAVERVKLAEKYLNRAIKRNIKGKLPTSTKKAIAKSGLKRSDFRGTKLKKDLGLKRALQSYHYKYSDGTGAVMMVLVKDEYDWYKLGYKYKGDKVYDVEFGTYAGALEPLSVNSYKEMISKIKRNMNKK